MNFHLKYDTDWLNIDISQKNNSIVTSKTTFYNDQPRNYFLIKTLLNKIKTLLKKGDVMEEFHFHLPVMTFPQYGTHIPIFTFSYCSLMWLLQSMTRTTEFFVVGIFSVILVKFAILVGTKSLGETTHCM